MAEATVHIAWDKFQNATTQMSSKLHTDETFADVTLVCAGYEQVRAHRVILSSASRFFEAVLAASPHHHPLLYLGGVRHRDLRPLLAFIYRGQAEVQEADLASFMAAGRQMGVKGLVEGAMEGWPDKAKEPINPPDQNRVDSKEGVKEILEKVTGKKKNKTSQKKKSIENDSKRGLKQAIAEIKEIRHQKTEIRNKLKSKRINSTNNTTAQGNIIENTFIDLATLEEAKKDADGKYPCQQCNFKNADLTRFRGHLAIHEGVKFSCTRPGCNQKYSNTNGRKRHEKKDHGAETDDRFGCDLCAEDFAVAEELKKHIVLSH
jgi:hypothetical protein